MTATGTTTSTSGNWSGHLTTLSHLLTGDRLCTSILAAISTTSEVLEAATSGDQTKWRLLIRSST